MEIKNRNNRNLFTNYFLLFINHLGYLASKKSKHLLVPVYNISFCQFYIIVNSNFIFKLHYSGAINKSYLKKTALV